ncbi:MAG: glycosyltransferase family 4 protein [Thermodesulfobacteriota bacterium]|nr:glycosyltransferase family 4 protein [Thermodesulfobacteriota bacterium]
MKTFERKSGKIKNVHIITRLDKGGSAENTLLTTLGLEKDKYDTVLVKGLSLESEMGSEEKLSVERGLRQAEVAGVKLISVPSLMRRINPVADLKALFHIYKILIKERPLIVHTHTSKAGILGRLAALLVGIPIVVHTPHGHVFYGYQGRIQTIFFILIEKLMASITDKIIALTENEKKEHLHFNVAQQDKFTVVPSGVQLRNFFENGQGHLLKEELGIPEEDSIVGTVGRLIEIKGQTFMLDAARLVLNTMPNTTFLFVGNGHLLDSLNEQAFALGIKDKVKFTGWRSDISQYISAMDIFVFPSLNEGMGRVLVEAMAAEKPIVASNIGGIPNLVKDGINGILFPSRDSDAMAEAIIKLLQDRYLAEKMGQEGRKRVYPAFDANTMVRKINGLYEELLMEKGRGILNRVYTSCYEPGEKDNIIDIKRQINIYPDI